VENMPVVESYLDVALNASMQRRPLPIFDLAVDDRNSIYFGIDVSGAEDHFEAFQFRFTALYHHNEASVA
jgi:hypothetical protein